MNPLAVIFLALFVLILAGSYIIVRRRLLPLRTVAVLCAVSSVSSIIAFGFAQDLQPIHAILAGVVAGILFTSVLMMMAAFFQANQPPAEEMKAYLKKE